ncbi:ATP-dependent endonuclease [bacterium]|nr:ATP-dependent endonuclease [bacterium]
MKNTKVKPLTKEQLIISIDRLTRFKNPATKYFRVYSDILINNLIYPKFKKNELENLDNDTLKNYAQDIINYSIEQLGITLTKNYELNKKIFNYETSVFKTDKNTQKFLDNTIDYQAFTELIEENHSQNLQWLKTLAGSNNIIQDRYEHSLHFPIEKVVITEGATEEILLPEFAKKCGYDFDKEGVHILSAGGKSQVVKLYYKLTETLKLPIFILLDKDAKANLDSITPRLRTIDKIHILACGEFEDLLPIDLIKRTINYELSNISMLEQEMLNTDEPRVKILEEVFKTRGMHEFKKVEFAKMVKNNIKTDKDITSEIAEIISEIRT